MLPLPITREIINTDDSSVTHEWEVNGKFYIAELFPSSDNPEFKWEVKITRRVPGIRGHFSICETKEVVVEREFLDAAQRTLNSFMMDPELVLSIFDY